MSGRAEIEATGSREVYRNRWMSVREDAVRFADGSAGTYGVVSKPDFALVVPFDGEAYWLVEQFRYPVGQRCWEFPQGSWEDAAGGDPLALAAGELAEETGLRAQRWQRLGHLYAAYGFCDQGFHVWLASDLVAGEQRLDATEQGLRVGSFSAAELDDMIRGGRLRDAPSVAAYGLLRLGAAGC